MSKCKIECIPQCLFVCMKRKSHLVKGMTGEELYSRFIKVNSQLYWNLDMKEVMENCEYIGHIKPYSLLIRSADIYIQSIRLAHEKRLLKAPEGFCINYIGDLDNVHCRGVQPSQFVALDEALCYIIYDLNLRGDNSTFELICTRLAEWYSGLQLPPQSLILATLRCLLDAGQVYYTGYGYSIMTTNKAQIAQWLQEQTPQAPIAEPDGDMTTTARSSSLSDVSVSIKNKTKQNTNSRKGSNPQTATTANITNEVKDDNKTGTNNNGNNIINNNKNSIKNNSIKKSKLPIILQTDNNGKLGTANKNNNNNTNNNANNNQNNNDPMSKSTDTVHFISRFPPVTTNTNISLAANPNQPTAIFLVPDPINVTDHAKRKGKSRRSAVKNFFNRLRPNKSRTRSSTDTGYYEDEDEEEPLYQYTAPASVLVAPSNSLPMQANTIGRSNSGYMRCQGRWLWHTSLQSLPADHSGAGLLSTTNAVIPNGCGSDSLASDVADISQYPSTTVKETRKKNHGLLGACRRSTSSHSRLSTQAVHDDSPPKKGTKEFQQYRHRHRNHRYRRDKSSSKKRDRSRNESNFEQLEQSQPQQQQQEQYSDENLLHYSENFPYSNGEEQMEEEPQYIRSNSTTTSHFKGNEYVLEDSGINSVISGSQPKIPSHSERTRSYHRYFRSLELDPTMTGNCDGSHKVSKTNYSKTKLPRSLSTKLSGISSGRANLDPVLEGQNFSSYYLQSRWKTASRITTNHDDQRHVMFRDSK